MLFKPRHIPLIRDGEKTATRRDWDENYAGPNVGSVVAATTGLFVDDEEADCYIRITDRYQERLGEINQEDARKEGGYTVQDFRDAWIDINGSWDPEQTVDVVEFEYVGRERPDGGDASDE